MQPIREKNVNKKKRKKRHYDFFDVFLANIFDNLKIIWILDLRLHTDNKIPSKTCKKSYLKNLTCSCVIPASNKPIARALCSTFIRAILCFFNVTVHQLSFTPYCGTCLDIWSVHGHNLQNCTWNPETIEANR